MIWFPDIEYWGPHKDLWKGCNDLKDALGKDKLVLIVGNGVSRLSGAPGWKEIFEEPQLKPILERQGIKLNTRESVDLPLLELAQVFKDNPGAWKIFTGVLWSCSQKAEPNIIHKLIKILQPGVILTTNIDSLLEKSGISFRKVEHLHGRLNQPEEWIFAKYDYKAQRTSVESTFKRIFPPNPQSDERGVALFIGYGHASEDDDIIEGVTNIPKPPHSLYTLIPANEATGIRLWRIQRQSITVIPYPLPKGATRTERLLAIATALQSLAKLIPDDKRHSEHSQVLKEVDDLRNEYTSNKQGGTLSIGLASQNILSTKLPPEFKNIDTSLPFPIPSRVNLRRKETKVLGGPGATTALILSKLGFPAVLVSKIADDAEGDFVFNELCKNRTKRKEDKVEKDKIENGKDKEKDEDFPLYIDLLERGPADEENYYQSWCSYVIVHPKDGQRVFMDRYSKSEFRTFNLFEGSYFSKSLRYLSPKEIYFDKFMQSQVQQFVNPGLTGFGKNVWAFYETGSSGDKSLDLSLTGKINFALCSFRHAHDFVAKDHLKAPIFIKNVLRKPPKEKFDLLFRKKSDLARFIKAVWEGGRKWLEDRDPAFIIVTLHELGCLWIDLTAQPDRGKTWDHVPSQVADKTICTAEAGDIFRAAFLAGVKEARKQKEEKNKGKDKSQTQLTSQELRDKMTAICDFANKAACARIKKLTVDKAIGDIVNEFKTLQSKIK